MAVVEDKKWFVMRDLKRRNSLTPAYKELAGNGFEVFTPTQWKIRTIGGKKLRIEEPVISDLLFVHATKGCLDTAVERISTLQYRYKFGRPTKDPTYVKDKDMEQFMDAIKKSDNVRYYMADEIRPEMYGKKVTIVGGPLNGKSGRLLSLRGSKIKRLIVEIPEFISAAVEVNPEFIRFE